MAPVQGHWDGRIHVVESRIRVLESGSQSRLASVSPAGDRAERRGAGAAATDDNSENKNQRDPQKLS